MRLCSASHCRVVVLTLSFGSCDLWQDRHERSDQVEESESTSAHDGQARGGVVLGRRCCAEMVKEGVVAGRSTRRGDGLMACLVVPASAKRTSLAGSHHRRIGSCPRPQPKHKARATARRPRLAPPASRATVACIRLPAPTPRPPSVAGHSQNFGRGRAERYSPTSPVDPSILNLTHNSSSDHLPQCLRTSTSRSLFADMVGVWTTRSACEYD